MGRQNLETRSVESLLVVCLSVFATSNRCSKDSCCAHKGLVTNWPHHNIWTSIKSNKSKFYITIWGIIHYQAQSPKHF